jgi:hypothetical protein
MEFQKAPVGYQKITEGLRPIAKESLSAWVAFPHVGAMYLLPVIKRSRRIFPVFHDDGSIGVETEEPNKELGALADDFLVSIAGEGATRSLTENLLVKFFRLVKALIDCNYDFKKPETFKKLLAMNEKELASFVSTIYTHCNGT